MDGNNRKCFLSLEEERPWLIVHLGDFHPVSLIRITNAEAMTRVNVYVGKKTPLVTDK